MWNWRIGALGLLGAVAVLLGAAGGLGQERAEAGKSQSIIVEKVTIPGGALQLFTFDPSWGPDFMLADGQSENPAGRVQRGRDAGARGLGADLRDLRQRR